MKQTTEHPTPSSPASARRFLARVGFVCVLFVCLGMLATFLIDPFYHYHAPWFHLKAVLTEKEYQVVGSLRHFDYDALIVGSSMIENNNNAWYDEAFGCRTIKAARSYGATADLCYLLDVAYEDHTLSHVFYNIDPSALHGPTAPTFAESGCPMYLYDQNPLNDLPYLLNKDVLLKRIPYNVLQSVTGDYDEGLSYNWAEGKNFSTDAALAQYWRIPEKKALLPEDYNAEALSVSIALLTDMVAAHPETTFHFFFPVYSMLWWDTTDRNGELALTFYEEREICKVLLQYENAEIFLFQDDAEIATDLDQFMDTIHVRPEINERMLRRMKDGTGRLHADTLDRRFDDLEALVNRWLSEEIVALEEADAFRYDWLAE